MKGETTVEQRIEERLRKLEQVRKFFNSRYNLDGPNWETELISVLIEHATYLSCYYGVDLETTIQETVSSVRRNYPDIP